jgi:putative DNA primase/helicase
LEAQRRFIGRTNTCSMPLQRLESDRFATSALYGKLVNCCADLPSEALTGTGVFKAITGGDDLLGERKFKPSFTFRPYSKLIFSANRMPQSPDDSDGFFRRWHVIPFNRRFAKDAPGTIPQDVLLAKLTAPSESSGLLNRALTALDRLRVRRHFTETPSIIEATTAFRGATDPLSIWIEQSTVFVPAGFIPQKELRDKYREACQKAGRALPSAMALTSMLKSIHPGIELKQRKRGADTLWCYVGIAWRTDDVSVPSPKLEHWASRYENYN